jgi:hypothetical protein
MGYITIIACVVLFLLLLKFGFARKKVEGEVLRWILCFMFAGMIWSCTIFISIILSFYPIKNWTVSNVDTTFMQPLPDQSYFMVNTDPAGNKTISYLHNGEICSRSIMKEVNSVFVIPINIKYDSTRNYKYDSVNKIYLPYMVRYTLTSNDSTLQKAFLGFEKTNHIDTLFVRDIKLLKVI